MIFENSQQAMEIAQLALDYLLENGVPENVENEVDWGVIELAECETRRLIDYQPDTSESPAEFERNGGYGLSAAERNK